MTSDAPMKHMAAKLMEKSPIDAADVARYTVERDQYHGDETFRRFLDVFHHRMLALFYLGALIVGSIASFPFGLLGLVALIQPFLELQPAFDED